MVNLDNLFICIKERGLTPRKLSEATGISDGNISDWKNGRSMPTALKLDILADYLDCSVDYLLGRTNDNKSSNSNGNITNSTVVQGINHSSVVMKKSSEQASTDEEIELLRIFKMLDVKHRHQLLDLAFSFEEKFNNK